MWTRAQAEIMAVQERTITEQMPTFRMIDKSSYGLTTVRGHFFSGSNTYYELAIWITKNYPYEMPGLYVLHPTPLMDYYGRLVTSLGSSHSYHIWSTDWSTYVKICYCKAEYWEISTTFVQILMKGMLWVEAYEVHKQTGQSIDSLSLGF